MALIAQRGVDVGVPGEMPRGGMTTAFFELMSSQDDTMIEAMHHLLTIHETVDQNPAYTPRPSPNSLRLVPQSLGVVCRVGVGVGVGVGARVRCSLQAWLRDEVHPEALELLLAQHSPHAVFIGFLQVVGFDHLFLLDLLISNETSFLAYLCQYLRHLTRDRKSVV